MPHDAGKEAAAESHSRSLVVWDVPSAIGVAEAFSIRVGVRCEFGCPPAGWQFRIHDHAGAVVATVEPDPEPWAGTEALFAARVELVAPAEEGLYAWQVSLPAAIAEAAAAPAHARAAEDFSVRVAAPGDCRVTVIALDRSSQSPVAGARVVAHPWQTVTDTDGVATLALPRGAHRLFVSGNGFLPLRIDAELPADTELRAELEPDVGPSDAEMWP